MAIPSTRKLVFKGANAEAIRSRDAEVCLCGPAGTGKSWAWLYKLHRAALKYPRMRGLILRKTRESLTESGLVTFEEKILSPYWRLHLAANCQRRVRQSYAYPNGSVLVVGGMDKPSKVMSTEYDMIYVQEAVELTENDWESLSSRIRNGRIPYQQIGADTNPDAPTHWLKQRIDQGQTRGLESRHEDNPAVTQEYLARLDKLTGVRYKRLRLGQWAGVEGQVYEGWERAIHLIDPFPISAGWPRIRAIDFGYVNPFTCQWWAIDGDGRMYLYREAYGVKRLVADWAREIERLSAGETYEFTVADHDAEDRATLRAAGIHTIAARKEVTPGIEAVQDRLIRQGDGKARLYIFRNALVKRDPDLTEAKKPQGFAEEIDSYTWALATEGRAAKEEPTKVNDHAMDCARYAVMAVNRKIGVPSALEDAQRAQEAAERAARDEREQQWDRPDNPHFWM